MERELNVQWSEQTLQMWREAFPDAPPADEVALRIRLDPCSVCGSEPSPSEIGGFDPEAITNDGLMIGKHVCLKCMEEGH